MNHQSNEMKTNNCVNSNNIKQVSLFKNLSISSLNCQNFKSNIIYAENLVATSDFSYLNELWLTQAEKPLLESIVKNNSHKVLFNSDMTHNYKMGRPFGGQAWFINSSFEIFDFKFINKHLSFVHIRKNDVNCVLIGSYMPFDDNKTLSRSEYELNISIISSILYNFDIIGISVFIVGDFNADIYRQKTFDSIFSKFISSNNLINFSSLFLLEVNHTYKKRCDINNTKNKQISNGFYHARLDHILFKKNTNQIDIIQCNVLDDIINMSDHRALRCEFKVMVNNNLRPVEFQESVSENVDFSNHEISEFFKNRIDKYSNGLFNEFFNNDNVNVANVNIDVLYDQLCNIIIKSYEETVPVQVNVNANKRKLVNKCNSLHKVWFTLQLKEIKDNIIYLNKQSKTEKNLTEIKFLKSNFRRIQRRNIHLNNCKEHDDLERIANLKDKDKFWKFIKSKRKRILSKPKVNVPSNELFDHYKKLRIIVRRIKRL